MATYVIREKMVCYVTWTYKVIAATDAEAFAKYSEGESTQIGEAEIGDNLDNYPFDPWIVEKT